MRKLLALLSGAALLFALDAWAFKPDAAAYLPEAQNDVVTAVIGLDEPPLAPFGFILPEPPVSEAPDAQPATSIEAHAARDSYPAGTATIELTVTNHNQDTVLYTLWFDIRRVEGERLIPVPTRGGSVVDADALNSFPLASGETVVIPVSLDSLEAPLSAGTYRAAQLVCFIDAQGAALACTEITAPFRIK